MLVEDGQTVFIGGLIRRSLDQNKEGVPILGDIPIVGRAFSNKSHNSLNTETVVMITPYIVENHNNHRNAYEKARAIQIQNELEQKANDTDKKINKNFGTSLNNSKNSINSYVEQEANQTAQNFQDQDNCSSFNPANLSRKECI